MAKKENLSISTCDTDSFLDIGSISLVDKSASEKYNIADVIAKAIMWNHGVSAPEMVLRTHTKISCADQSSPHVLGLSDGAKSLGADQVFGTVSNISCIQHGNIVAFYHHDSRRFLRLAHGKVDVGGGDADPHKLPRRWQHERFLVIQVEDKHAFYSISNNQYMRRSGIELDGKGGELHLDPPRFCELFEVTEGPPCKQSLGRVQIKTPSGECVALEEIYTVRLSAIKTSPKSMFRVILVSDALANKSTF